VPAGETLIGAGDDFLSKNLGDILDGSCLSDKAILIEAGGDGASTRVSWTYPALNEAINSASRALLKQKLKRGDRIGILALNCSEFVIVYFAAMRAGMTAVPVNWKLPADTIAYIAQDAAIKLFFVDRERKGLMPGGIPAIELAGVSWSEFVDPGPFKSIAPRAEEIAQILYTSGSTGRPKGVPLSHDGQRWAIEAFSTEDVSSHRLLVAAPLFHMNALVNLKFAFHNGAAAVLLPAFTAHSYIAAIIAHHVTWLTSVPTMLAMVAREIGDGPAPDAFRQVTRIFMGSSPFGQSLLDRVRNLFPNASISNGYGTTEAGPAVFGRHPAGIPTPDLSMGYPIVGAKVRIVDEKGQPISGLGEGVLQMRTPAIMSGYLNMPEQTERAIHNGWYHSNDIVRRDANGFYYFVGRADDMFVSGGENVYPGEVEKMLEQHPGVQQAIVVAVPDEIKQALPFAFVVREPGPAGKAMDESTIREWALRNAPAYQHPRWVEFVETMPLSGTNKIDRGSLNKLARDIAARRGR
jgi:acyl-CoA synthetase (AMP-forming)/AMP-acid ligase II